ncbi:hypothetical protein ATO13_09721 [Stappia sp. 22II-S9-Z10]|nr:hypothetical protein ATO13_09721 [Stappia sp. 22II-S9-Z10]
MRLLIAAVVAVLCVGEAAAQSCTSLRNQLAAAQSGGGSADLQRQYRAYGCNASGFGRHRACAGIEARMRRGGNTREVAALQRRVASACAEQRVVRREAPKPKNEEYVMIGGRLVAGVHTEGKRDRGIFSGLFGSTRRVQEERRVVSYEPDTGPSKGVERVNLTNERPTSSSKDSYSSSATRSSGHRKGEMRYGSSRTVCVRLCDGFYFPINNNSHSDNFYDELAMCVGRCPGADVSLYSHNNSSPVESMRSTMTGESYVNLPTAFAYRKRVVSGCGCQPQSIGAPNSKDIDAVVASLRAKGEAQTATDGASAAETAAAAAAASQEPQWTPFRAVYDETGQPLPPLKTDRTSEPPARLVGLTLPEAPEDDEPAAGSSSIAMNQTDDYRDVGPQFFSETQAATDRIAVRQRRQGIVTSAVTVIPLTPEAAAAAAAAEDDPVEVTPLGSAPARVPADSAQGG